MTTTSPTGTAAAGAFELKAGRFSPNELIVLGFEGTEALSKLYRFDIDVAAPEGVDLSQEADFVGMRATFVIRHEARTRAIHGRVGRVTSLDGAIRPVGSTAPRKVFRVTLVPALWLMRHASSSRVFQDKTVPAVVKSLLDTGEGLFQPCEIDRLSESYSSREYCVQYKETDWDFCKRIVREEGILFYFALSTDPDQTVEDALVLVDRASAYPVSADGAPSLHVSGRMLDQAASRGGAIERFESSHTIATNSVLLRDFDSAKPLLDLQAQRSFDSPRRARELEPDWELRVYDHRGEYLVPDPTPARASARLEQHRRRAHVSKGASGVRTLAPGYRFNVETDDGGGFAGEYVITSLRHRGRLPEYGGEVDRVYENSFECVRSNIPYRPKRPKPFLRQVLEPAIVTGPETGTVHTDEHGRVRVQFMWDQNGTMDERSTTWLRVVQPWAGASYGLQLIPRVGMEVMVSFLGGDPDCPVVIGAVHDAARPPPFHLPEQKTRSGFHTQSTPGGEGFNELSFEDASGAEQIYLHAQRDLDCDVQHNHTLNVKKSHTVQIGEAQTIHIKGQQEVIVEGQSNRVVEQDEKVSIRGNHATSVEGSASTTVENERRAFIRKNDDTSVLGRWTLDVGDDLTTTTKGCHTTLVGKADARRSYLLRVEGTADISSRERLELQSEEGIRLRCGESIVEIMPDRIELISPKVCVRTPDARVTVDHDQLYAYAKKDAVIKSGDSILLASSGASLTLKTEFKASGKQILLNSPDVAQDPPRETPPPPTVVEIVDDHGQPIPNSRFVLVLGDGSERSYFTDEHGRIEIDDLDESAKIALPGLLSPGAA